MKTAIAYEVFYSFIFFFFFLKEYIFEDLLIFNALYQKYIANITFKQFIKCCFTLSFYNFINKWEKEKKKIIRKTKQCYYNDICGWKRHSFFPLKLKLEGESFE